MSDTWLLGAIVLVCLTCVMVVVLVGGIVCVTDDDYSFAEYVSDLKGVYKLLLSAILGAVARALLPLVNKLRLNNNNR